jgi:hypothetical protein
LAHERENSFIYKWTSGIYIYILCRVDPLLRIDRKQRVPSAKNQRATTEELWEVVFSVDSAAVVATQRRAKHVSAAKNPDATMDELF